MWSKGQLLIFFLFLLVQAVLLYLILLPMLFLISTFARTKNRQRTCWLAARATKEKIQGGDNLRLRPRLDGRELAKEPQQQAGSLSLQSRPQYTWMSTAKGKTRAGSLSVSQSAKSILEMQGFREHLLHPSYFV